MYDAIKSFNEQFRFEPEIIEKENLGSFKHIIVAGMGGSHLAADLLPLFGLNINLRVWSDYGLPNIREEEKSSALVICSSYSGNTEETIDVFETARRDGFSVAVITTGGKLLELAKESRVPHVILPNTGIQPRMALGYCLISLLALTGQDIGPFRALAGTLNPSSYEEEGKALAEKLQGKVPVIYASHRNQALAYNWKIKFNETGKIPAFYNVLPELNHNEMTGFDVAPSTEELSANLHFVFLEDSEDNTQIQKRMQVVQKLYEARGFKVEVVPLSGEAHVKIFSTLIVADWTAYYIAQNYGLDPERVPMVEEFKKMIA